MALAVPLLLHGSFLFANQLQKTILWLSCALTGARVSEREK